MINTSFYTGIGTAIGFVSGFVVNKVVAVLIGPGGVALVSQFQNFIGMVTTVATGGIQQGVVKYVAEVRADINRTSILLSTSLKITLFFAMLVGITTTMFAGVLSEILFDSRKYRFVLLLFGITVVLFGLNNLLISILNGIGEIRKLVLVKISSNMFSLLVTATFAYFYKLSGALIALAISNSVIFFISLLFVIRSDWFSYRLFSNGFNRLFAMKLFRYSLMAVSSMVLPPLVQIGIRNHIIENLSIDQAGYWDGLWKISAGYLGIITTTLSIYYLPKLSSLKKRLEIRDELLSGYSILTPVLMVLIIVVYFLKDHIILLLYSTEFLMMRDLFGLQLLGDFFKVVSWLLAYLMLAKAKTLLFIGSQIVFSAMTYFLSIYLIDQIGLKGVVMAHSVNYFIYLVTMFLIFKKYLLK